MSDSALTLDTILAAKGNDLEAMTLVIRETESRIAHLARAAARRVHTAHDAREDATEELTQIGRIVVWESLARFEGDSVSGFFGWIYRTIETRFLDETRNMRTGVAGVGKDVQKTFGAMMTLANQDVYVAERLAQTVPPKGQRLSADMARAVRLAWTETLSLDLPRSDGEVVVTLADLLEVPEDLLTSDDYTREEARVKREVVRGILDVMGATQSEVLRHSFGIGGAECFGYGRDDNRDEELGEFLGITTRQVQDARNKGFRAFAKRYVDVAAKSPEEAAELTAAAARRLTR